MARRGMAAVVLLAAALLVAPPTAITQPASGAKAAADQQGIGVWVHGRQVALATRPTVVRGNTLVPLRETASALGAAVKTGKDAKGRLTVTLTRGDRTAVLTVGVSTMTADGRAVTLPVAPQLQGNVTMVPLRALSESLGTVVTWDSVPRIVRIDEPAELPAVGTAARLRELAASWQQSRDKFARTAIEVPAAAFESVPAAAGADEAGSQAPSAAPQPDGGYAATNVQVAGVDEADWAKTDGRYVYQISGTRVMVVSIADPAKPKLTATLEEAGFQPSELYAEDGMLIVIGQHAWADPTPAVPQGDASAAVRERIAVDAKIAPPYGYRSAVSTRVYALDADGQPKLVRETEMEGGYVSSRKIGSALYVIANKFNDLYAWAADDAGANTIASRFEPAYADSAASVSGKLTARSVPLKDIRYFPDSPDASTLLIGALDLDRPALPLQVSAYLGAGQTVYASQRSLYVAVGRYAQDGKTLREETQVYKFRLDQGSALYLGTGSVPGTLLNQFSMDEHQGFFRIATTRGNAWGMGSDAMTNNLYVLDESLKTIGALENLAPGERIYSARFLGNRAYLVTFRLVDPLFALDLSDPTAPRVLGQLKIPGYSDYLHPYDETHLIGFGKDTVELSVGGAKPGSVSDTTMAYYQGLKVGMFDVSDPTHPKEQFKEVIGDRGTHSELLQNHKALLFSKEKGLMAFPVELMEVTQTANDENGPLAYGRFTFQGAYVYGVDLRKGFTLQGRITHLSDEDLAKSGQYGDDAGKYVRRILYAGDTLYTLSDRMLKANDLRDLQERGALTYPAPDVGSSLYERGPMPVGPAVMPAPMP